MKLLMDYEWPGNVRELENAVERAVVLSTGDSMDADLLPENIHTREIVKGVRFELAEFMQSPQDGSGFEIRRRLLRFLKSWRKWSAA